MKAIKVLEFRINGVPQPRGSKKPITGRGRRRGLLIDDNAQSGPWMEVVSFYAKRAMRERELIRPFDGPLCLKAIFFRERPASHYSKRGGLLPSAPAFPATKPDCSKLMRAIEDAMNQIVYDDDGRLVDSWPSKRWGKSGVLIQLYRLPETVAQLETET